MNALRLILALLVATMLVVFGAQNTQSVSFHFLGGDTPSIPVVLALAIALALGALLAWLSSLPSRYRGRRERRDLQRRLQDQERLAGPAPGASESSEPPAT